MENSFVSCHLRGGLGNYLFQISAAYFISKRDNKKLKVDYSDISVIHSPLETYFNNILRKIPFGTVSNFDLIHDSGQPISYSEIPKIDGNIKLGSYYQNEKYLIPYEDEIRDLFEIDEKTKKYLDDKYSNIINLDTCSLHVRRGNYLERSEFHPVQNIEYYKLAISIVGEDKHFLIFSDDIEWCENNLDFIPKKTFISGNVDYQDLYLMSMCNHNIIANSSFSWWGAWMNKNKHKKVIYPSKWFGVDFLNTSEIGGRNWIKI